MVKIPLLIWRQITGIYDRTMLELLVIYIPLISRVFGPYCKLRTEFFRSVIYSTDRKNEANKMFIISLWLYVMVIGLSGVQFSLKSYS